MALTWLLRDASAKDSVYAVDVLKALGAAAACAEVPTTWGLDVSNVVSRCEARAILSAAQTGSFLDLIKDLPIEPDPDTDACALSSTLELARRSGLSSYDAAYLDLALRRSLPLASLDRDLNRAATQAGVKLFEAP